jgi:hypothetical protein
LMVYSATFNTISVTSISWRSSPFGLLHETILKLSNQSL